MFWARFGDKAAQLGKLLQKLWGLKGLVFEPGRLLRIASLQGLAMGEELSEGLI